MLGLGDVAGATLLAEQTSPTDPYLGRKLLEMLRSLQFDQIEELLAEANRAKPCDG